MRVHFCISLRKLFSLYYFVFIYHTVDGMFFTLSFMSYKLSLDTNLLPIVRIQNKSMSVYRISNDLPALTIRNNVLFYLYNPAGYLTRESAKKKLFFL